MRITKLLWMTILAAGMAIAPAAFAQEKPADMPHGMEHMHHGSGQGAGHGAGQGGFMQGGMHHALAKGVTLEQSIDGQTITLRVGPINLPAHTSHMQKAHSGQRHLVGSLVNHNAPLPPLFFATAHSKGVTGACFWNCAF